MDFNFFEHYKTQKGKTNIISLIFVSITTAAAGIILIMILFLFLKVTGLEGDIKKHKKLMEEDQFKASLLKVSELQAEINKVKGEADAMQFFMDMSADGDSVEKRLLDTVAEHRINGLALANFEITDNEVLLAGSARNFNELAQLQYDLGKLDVFENIRVTTTDEVDGDINILDINTRVVTKMPYTEREIEYSFIIEMDIKKGVPSEEN